MKTTYKAGDRVYVPKIDRAGTVAGSVGLFGDLVVVRLDGYPYDSHFTVDDIELKEPANLRFVHTLEQIKAAAAGIRANAPRKAEPAVVGRYDPAVFEPTASPAPAVTKEYMRGYEMGRRVAREELLNGIDRVFETFDAFDA